MSKNKELKSGKPFSVKVYATHCYERYGAMSKCEKSRFLDDLCQDLGCSRQHAIRLFKEATLTRGFSEPVAGRAAPQKRGRKAVYSNDDNLISWLQEFWRKLNYPNTKLLPSMLLEWMPYFSSDELPVLTRQKLLKMSGSTMESILKTYKREHGKKHFAATRNKGRLKNMLVRVPERDLDFKITTCGYMEADTVAHCGSTLRGQHAWTLNIVCVHSAWTESEASLGKEDDSILKSLVLMRQRLPFAMRGFHSDCGSELINNLVCGYLEDPKHYVIQTHGRAYKKNDQARVEQRNWTQVRQSFGYDRVEEQRVVDCMNDIYRTELRIVRNFFTPTLKQASKVRVNSKYKRKFEKPRTPFQRIMEDSSISQNIKDKLQKEKDSHNPFEVQKRLEQKLKFFEKLLQNQTKKPETNDEEKKEAA